MLIIEKKGGSHDFITNVILSRQLNSNILANFRGYSIILATVYIFWQIYLKSKLFWQMYSINLSTELKIHYFGKRIQLFWQCIY